MEQAARDYIDKNLNGWWVFARVLLLLSILLMIAWSSFSSGGDYNIRFEVQANGRPLICSHSSELAKQLLSKEAELQKIMKHAALFMESQLYTTPETPRKTVALVTLSFEDSISLPLVIMRNNIYISSKYIYNNIGSFQGLIDADVELERLIYIAMAHVWLWDGKGGAPLGLMEAMANLLTSFAGLNSLNTARVAISDKHLHVNEDEGQQWAWSLWDSYGEGQPLTTSFLAFCEAAKPGFLSALNSELERGWNQSYFQDLINRNVEDLWSDYKALNLHTSSDLHTSSASSSLSPTIVM